ncbi:MAG: hypothetical protein ACHQAW_02950 [Actinomycetota bacterium]|jgi:hypothetical protein
MGEIAGAVVGPQASPICICDQFEEPPMRSAELGMGFVETCKK